MRTNIYFTPENRARADALAKLLGLPLARLFNFLIEYYLRKEKIKLDKIKEE
jgi:hypothetical protein